MDKPAIKKFAVWARNKLIADTKYRAGLVGVTETAVAEPLPQSNETVQFFDVGLPQPYRIEGDAVTQRQRFVAELNKETAKQGSYTAAYQTVVDKVAYTWFNRLIAVRYMEVNDLLPSRTRVLSSADGRAEPQIVTSPFDAVLDYTPAEQQQIVNLKNDNKLDEAFRLLFLKQCAALGDCLPRLFEQVDDYMPLLLALSFTDKDGVVCHLVNDIPESDWQDAVQIVGWLYQYYNTEPKEQVFANLKKNIKISKENIPAATQLFTPDWIVRYMVENSLGRLWSEGHPDFDKSKWKYYLDEAPQEPQVAQQLAELRKGYAALTPEDIKQHKRPQNNGLRVCANLLKVRMGCITPKNFITVQPRCCWLFVRRSTAMTIPGTTTGKFWWITSSTAARTVCGFLILKRPPVPMQT